ncbi:MAG: molybdopterin molybdotransferase MoeA [Candidatus Caldarchaeales archaeon]
MKSLRLVTLEEARRAAEAAGSRKTLDRVELPIEEAVGRIVAEPVFSSTDVPGVDRAALDGFATKFDFLERREGDGAVRLRLSEAPVDGPWAVSVFTGQPTPPGSDVVIRAEHARLEGQTLYFRGTAERWENVERRGSFFGAGDPVVERGDVIRPPHVAVLSELGVRRVSVYRRPRCAVISIGGELLGDSGRAIPNDYAHVVASYLSQMGCGITSIEAVGDGVEEVAGAVEEAAGRNDLVVTVGRASSGSNDVVQRAYSGMEGAEVLFHGVRLHPGKPTGLVMLGEKCWLILPASLTAAIAGLHLIGVPYLRSLIGLRTPPPELTARLDGDAPGRPGVSSVYFVSIGPSGDGVGAKVLPKGVNNLYTASKANGFLVVPPGAHMASGEAARLTLLGRLTY